MSPAREVPDDCTLNSDLTIRPIFHQAIVSIEAHVLIPQRSLPPAPSGADLSQGASIASTT
jgi:hypothetical protein